MGARRATRTICRLEVLGLLVAAAMPLPAVAEQSFVPLPALSAERALVLDPSTGEELYAKNADSRALQGSIAKILTLHTALVALESGFVSLSDPVALSTRATQQPCTCLVDNDGNGLPDSLPLEVFTFEQLLYGISVSAGEATDAVAEHVGGAMYFFTKEPSGSIEVSEMRMRAFLEVANVHAQHAGATDSYFATVHGGDVCDFSIGCGPACAGIISCSDTATCFPPTGPPPTTMNDPSVCGGGTTVRDLAALWQHAAADHPMFLQILGTRAYGPFSSSLSDYTITKNFSYYPGVDADKNGGSTMCVTCFLSQATRGGRTLYAVLLQSQNAFADVAALLRYGFARLFGPDRRESSGSLGGKAGRHALGCGETGDAASAVVTPSGRVRLILWWVDTDTGTLEKVDQWTEPVYVPLQLPPGGLFPESVAGLVGRAMDEADRILPPADDGLSVAPFFSTEPDVDVAVLGSQWVVATVARDGGVEAFLWRLVTTPKPGAPTIELVSRKKLTNGAKARVERLSDDTILLGSLVGDTVFLTTWRVDAGGFDQLGGTSGNPGALEFSLAAEAAVLRGGWQAVVATRRPADSRLVLWSADIDSGGSVSWQTNSGTLAGAVRHPSVVRNGPSAYATAVTVGDAPTGPVKVIFWSVAAGGSFTRLNDTAEAGVEPASGTAIAAMDADAVLTAHVAASGTSRVSAWSVPVLDEGPAPDRLMAAGNDFFIPAEDADLCRLAPDDVYVAASRDAPGNLVLWTWRLPVP